MSIKFRFDRRQVGLILAAACFTLLLSNCASMSGEGSHQTTLVRSSPPGASIFVEGKKVGQTPEYVEVRRKARPSIELDTASGRKPYELSTNYRWGRSFWGNLGFLVYAPVGWLVDFATGAAWDIRPDQTLEVSLSSSDKLNPKQPRTPKNVVIAPPRSASSVLSDSAGRALEARLKASGALPSGSVLRPYDETLAAFLASNYELGPMDEGAKQRLMLDLKADYIYESYSEPADAQTWRVRTVVSDLSHGERAVGPTLLLKREGPSHDWWSRLMPNTLGLDFVTDNMRIDLGNQSYDLEPVHDDVWWAQGLKYFSAITVLSVPDRRRQYGSRWEISAIPSFRVSRRVAKIGGLTSSSGGFIEKEPIFERWSLSGGYGLEFGFLFGRHYLYMDLIPVFNWSEISWRQQGRDRWASGNSITAQAEFGYTFVMQSNWVLRLFSKSQEENVELWKNALVARLGAGYAPTSARSVVSGVTLAYRFDSDRYRAEAERENKRGR